MGNGSSDVGQAERGTMDETETALRKALALTSAIGESVRNEEFAHSSELMLERERLLEEVAQAQDVEARDDRYQALWKAIEEENDRLLGILREKQSTVSFHLREAQKEKMIAAYKH